jgi:hypothetical protein
MSRDLETPAHLIFNVKICYEMDGDALDGLTRQLRREMLDLEFESVDLVREGDDPEEGPLDHIGILPTGSVAARAPIPGGDPGRTPYRMTRQEDNLPSYRRN